MSNLIKRLQATDRCYCGSQTVDGELKLVACLFHQAADTLEQAQAETKFFKEWIDSLLADGGPINSAHNELSRYFLHAGIDTDVAMNTARKFLESAIDSTYEGFPESTGDKST